MGRLGVPCYVEFFKIYLFMYMSACMYSCMTEEASDPVIDDSEPPAVPGNCISIITEPSLPSPYVEFLRARTSCLSLLHH